MLAVARDVLITEGLVGLSMRGVAKEVGLSATAIYRHFKDKDHLVSAAVLQGFRVFASYLLDALEQGSAEARLQTIGRRYFDFAIENQRDYQLIFMTDCKLLALPRLDETSRKEINGTFQMLMDRIVECQREKIVRKGDARSLAAYTWASMHGLASLIVSGNLGESDEEIAALTEQHLRLLLISLRC